MQVLDALQSLQADHHNCFQAQPAPATHPQHLHILAQLLDHQEGPSVLFEGLLDLGEAVEVGLFQFLVGLDLVLDESALLLVVALDEEDHAVAADAALDQFVVDVL
jgi:hypothetical protein